MMGVQRQYCMYIQTIKIYFYKTTKVFKPWVRSNPNVGTVWVKDPSCNIQKKKKNEELKGEDQETENKKEKKRTHLSK